MTQPEDLLYGVDKLPPLPCLFFLGMPYAMLISVYLVLIVIVFQHAGASHAVTLKAPSRGMIALAAFTVLQSISKYPADLGAASIFGGLYWRRCAGGRHWRPCGRLRDGGPLCL
jgi:hypothetical protein